MVGSFTGEGRSGVVCVRPCVEEGVNGPCPLITAAKPESMAEWHDDDGSTTETVWDNVTQSI